MFPLFSQKTTIEREKASIELNQQKTTTRPETYYFPKPITQILPEIQISNNLIQQPNIVGGGIIIYQRHDSNKPLKIISDKMTKSSKRITKREAKRRVVIERKLEQWIWTGNMNNKRKKKQKAKEQRTIPQRKKKQ